MKLRHLIGFLAIVFIVQVFGSIYFDATWYDSIQQPSWTPPNWVFAPVWTVLYIMIGIVGARLFDAKKGALRTQALRLYFFQLGFNAVWSWIFFGLHSITFALIDLILITVFLGLLLRLCFKFQKASGWLLVPYFVWTLYALSLNLGLWFLNEAM